MRLTITGSTISGSDAGGGVTRSAHWSWHCPRRASTTTPFRRPTSRWRWASYSVCAARATRPLSRVVWMRPSLRRSVCKSSTGSSSRPKWQNRHRTMRLVFCAVVHSHCPLLVRARQMLTRSCPHFRRSAAYYAHWARVLATSRARPARVSRRPRPANTGVVRVAVVVWALDARVIPCLCHAQSLAVSPMQMSNSGLRMGGS